MPITLSLGGHSLLGFGAAGRQIWFRRWPALGAKLGKVLVPKMGTKYGAQNGATISFLIGGARSGNHIWCHFWNLKTLYFWAWRRQKLQKSVRSLTHWPPGATPRLRRGWLAQRALARNDCVKLPSVSISTPRHLELQDPWLHRCAWVQLQVTS